MSELITPNAWKENLVDDYGYGDNEHPGSNEDILRRTPGSGKTRYSRVSDWGEGKEEFLPDWMVPDTGMMTPEEVQTAFDRLEDWSRPRLEGVFERGRQKGRDEIRGVLRDLVGPETARNAAH